MQTSKTLTSAVAFFCSLPNSTYSAVIDRRYSYNRRHCMAVNDPKPLTPGTQIGEYRIESELGKGGMGVVYRASDTKLSRPVAIKFLSPRMSDVAARHRFQREAQMASALNHPHILTVHDV